MKPYKLVGIHIRYQSSIFDVLDRITTLDLAIAQFFLMKKGDLHHFVNLDQKDKNKFIDLCKEHLENVVFHASYLTDLASGASFSKRLFLEELEAVGKFDNASFVFHAGSAKRFESKEKGIENIAKVLNNVFKRDLNVQVLLENSVYKGYYVGSDLEDFACLKKTLNIPEKLKFCIDTAHAYSYGYDLASEEGMESFIKQIDKTIGFDSVGLIHLNNTKEKLGCSKDEHSSLENGKIPLDNLKKIACHPKLAGVPIILELPKMSEEKEKKGIELVLQWRDSLK